MRARRIAVSAAVALAVMTRSATGDPRPGDPAPPLTNYLHFKTPSMVQTDGGTNLRLPPGYFLDEPTHDKLDREIRRLQGRETRLDAENKHLRGTLSSWQPGWVVVVSALAAGVALGWYATR